jgi:hypothetical protein
MIRVVLDADVFISGVLGIWREESMPGAEYPLGPRKRSVSSSHDRRNAIAPLNQQTPIVEITHLVSGIASHPEDDLVLAAAVPAGVDYLWNESCFHAEGSQMCRG